MRKRRGNGCGSLRIWQRKLVKLGTTPARAAFTKTLGFPTKILSTPAGHNGARERQTMQIDVVGRSAEKPPIDPTVAACCLQFGLAPAEGAALVKLLSGNFVSRQELRLAISSNPRTTPKIVEVTIYKLRRKLLAHGMKIITRYKIGYRLDKSTRALLASLHGGPQRLTEHVATSPRTQEKA
jgi:hypothetical protein